MKQNSDKRTRTVVYTILILMLGVFLTYGFIYKFPAMFQETITRIEKDVTVTDKGIADAVEKSIITSPLTVQSFTLLKTG